MKLSELDKNFQPQNQTDFRRMPEDVAKSISNGVEYLSQHTAGGRPDENN